MGDQQYPSMSGPPDDWYPHGAPQLPPAGYYNRFTIYPPSDELPPPSPFRDNDPYSAPRTTTTSTTSNSNHYQGPPPEAFWSPHPRHPTPFAPSPYSPPHQLQSPSAPWPHLSAGVGDPGDSYAPPPVLRVSSGRQAFLPKRTTMPPPRSWPSPPNDNTRLDDDHHQPDAFEDDDYADDDHANTASLDDDKEDAAANDDDDDAKQHFPASPAGRLAVNDFEKSSPSSQATEHTSNHNNNKKKKDPLSMLAKTASNIGPPKKRLGRFDQAGSSPLSVSPIPTSTRRTIDHSNEESERQNQQRANGPKPITPGNYYSPEAADPNGTTPDNRRQPMAPPPPPPPPQYSHRAYHANSSYRYEPWQGQPLPVCSFDSHESAQRNRAQHGAPPYYYGNGPDPYRQYPPPPPESYRGGPGPWYPPPPPPRPMPPPPSQHHHHHQQHQHRSPPPRQQQPVTPYYQSPPQQQPPPEPSAAAATKRKSAASGPYTQVQQQKRRGNEKHLLRKKFSWKQYPELEQFLVHHRDQYLAHSCKNYSLEQKQYNNWLTHKLIETAEASNLFFDPHEFNFVAIRDRIRCYYKSYVQTARKRGLPLPSELEKSRTVLNSKKPRLEDIETTGNDEASSDNSDRTEETNVESKKETALTPAPVKATPALPDRQMETLANETAPPTAKLSENGVVDAVAVTKLDTTSATESKDDRNEPMADLAGQPMIVTRRMATRGITRGSR